MRCNSTSSANQACRVPDLRGGRGGPGRGRGGGHQSWCRAGPSACQVSYSVSSDWGSGFTAAITIQNTGSAITSWTLGYSYAGNQKISQGWSGNWSRRARRSP